MERDIIKNSKTKSQAVRSIYGYDNGTSRRKFEKLIKENEIDISHLTKQPFIYERKIKDCPVCGNKFETMENDKITPKNKSILKKQATPIPAVNKPSKD